MATTKVGLTPAQKRKATRERKQAEASARYAHCERMFESMTDEEREDMVDKLEAIKEFIVGVLMVIPRPSEAEREWQMVTIEFDPEMLKLPFSARRAKVATDVLSVPPVPAEHHTRS